MENTCLKKTIFQNNFNFNFNHVYKIIPFDHPKYLVLIEKKRLLTY